MKTRMQFSQKVMTDLSPPRRYAELHMYLPDVHTKLTDAGHAEHLHAVLAVRACFFRFRALMVCTSISGCLNLLSYFFRVSTVDTRLKTP